MQLVKFIFDEDDMGNECGLTVEFETRNADGVIVDVRIRNAVVMSKRGKRFNSQETANALRNLARWCETLAYNTKGD